MLIRVPLLYRIIRRITHHYTQRTQRMCDADHQARELYMHATYYTNYIDQIIELESEWIVVRAVPGVPSTPAYVYRSCNI